MCLGESFTWLAVARCQLSVRRRPISTSQSRPRNNIMGNQSNLPNHDHQMDV